LRSEPAAETDLCGLGAPTVNGKADPLEVVMASAQPKPDFKRQWAVKDSNLRPWD
jgi:hypothetical protein